MVIRNIRLSHIGVADKVLPAALLTELGSVGGIAPLTKFSSFIPGQLLARTAGDATDGPACAHFDGAVIFADISGYTSLAERFCAQGVEGAEQLSNIQNRAFSSYISCIHNSGGEVANFAGDALLAYWPATCEEPAAAL